MDRREISATFDAFLRLQALCGAVILASWLVLWADNNPVKNVRDLFLYVLTQINLTVVLLHPLKFLYEHRRSRYHWPLHVIFILTVSAIVVVASAALIYRVDGLNLPFIEFLHRSWKFPFVANLVFAFAYEGYKVTTRRLDKRNQQLQHTIEVGTAERETEAAELHQACEIQRGLLPRDIPQLPEFEITGSWQPAKVVGGDYYDIIQLTPDKLAICIADVAGKGVSAALLMANVQAAVRAFSSETASPSNVCSKINSVLCTNIAPDKFVTLFYGVLDAPSRKLRYTNAGHLQPILIAENGHVTHLENGGALLGVFPTWKYEDSTVQLGPSDLLLLFTDGITEAMTSDGGEFGEGRLIETAINSTQETLDGLELEILDEVKRFCNSHLSDDATLVLVAALRGKSEQRQLALNRDIASEQLTQYAGVRS